MGMARGAWAVRLVVATSLASAAGCPQQVPVDAAGGVTSGTGMGGATATTSTGGGATATTTGSSGGTTSSTGSGGASATSSTTGSGGATTTGSGGATTSSTTGGGGANATSSTTGSGGATSSTGNGGSPPLDCGGPALPAGQVEWTVPIAVAKDPPPGPSNSPVRGVPVAVLVGSTGHAFVDVTWGDWIGPNQFGGDVVEEIDAAGTALGDRAMASLGSPEGAILDVAGATAFAAAFEGADDEYDNGVLVSNGAKVLVSNNSDPPWPSNPFMPYPDAFVVGAAADAAGDAFGLFEATAWMFPWGEEGGYLAVKLDSHGQHVWTTQIPVADVTGAQPWQMAADEGGGVFVSAQTPLMPSDLGCGPLPSSTPYLARLDENGACVFSRAVPLSSLVPTHRGDVYLTGAFQGTIDLGCGPMTSAPGATSSFVAQVLPDGTCGWSRGVAVSTMGAWAFPGGGVLVAASYGGTIDLGGGPMTSAGAEDTAVARYDGEGALVWSRSFGAAGAAVSWVGGAADATGGAALSFSATGAPVDFGGGPTGGGDGGPGSGVLVRLDASGAFRWQQAPFEGAFGSDPCGAVITAAGCPSCTPANEYTVTATKLAP
jgi:hypothetical protein